MNNHDQVILVCPICKRQFGRFPRCDFKQASTICRCGAECIVTVMAKYKFNVVAKKQ